MLLAIKRINYNVKKHSLTFPLKKLVVFARRGAENAEVGLKPAPCLRVSV